MSTASSTFMLAAKRRVYRIALLLTAVATALPVLWALNEPRPTSAAHIVTNTIALALCLAAVAALSRLCLVPLVERVLVGAVVVYDLAWAVINLATGRPPVEAGIVGGAPTFLLSCILLCLVLPYELIAVSLLVFYVLHVSLTWLNLIDQPWGDIHTQQLSSDVVVLVAILVLALLSTYQRLASGAEGESRAMLALAHTDEATGVANRRGLSAMLFAAASPCVIMAHLAPEVDTAAGPRRRRPERPRQLEPALKLVAEFLADTTGHGAEVGRWSENSLLVVWPNGTLEDAVRAAQRAQTFVATTPELAGLTIRLGVTHRRADEPTSDLVGRADELALLSRHDASVVSAS